MKSVSIVIPCRNEEKYIGRCIDSILAQDYSADKISVYICDGKSTDQTPAIVNDYTQKHKNVNYLINEKKTTPFALNLGINNSKGDIVIILGAHSELYPDYVTNCVEAFNFGSNIGCTGGIIENVYENDTAEVIGKAMSSSFGVGNAHFRTGNQDGFVDTVAFGAYKREVFNKIGLFDDELVRNQDDEFNYRLLSNGFTIYLYRKIRSKYFVRASFEKLFKQYEQYGYWKVYVNKKHKAVTTVRQVVPLFFVLFLFVGILMSVIHTVFLKMYIVGLLFYFTLSLISAYNLSSETNKIFRIMKGFFILHFSYGWGYLKGIIDFFILQKKIKKDEILTR
ncbi:MAG: glycosyltransferase family 2 protein [Bacteroidetes bacterium]|nr:glycosyltransferase family 2 protein [Bacteroidota bacterium]